MSKTISIVKCKECKRYFTFDKVKWFNIWNNKDFVKTAMCYDCSREVNQKPKQFNAKTDIMELLNSGKAKIKI